jgi:hypothetical protein
VHNSSTTIRSHRGFATLVIDGGQPVKDVVAEVSRTVSKAGESANLLAVGQKGSRDVLHVLAKLESEGRAPTFTLTRVSAKEVHSHAPRSDSRVEGQNNYRAELPARSTWEAPDAMRALPDQRLTVGNKTGVMGLAKAIAARAKMLPVKRSFVVETAVGGKDAFARLRFCKLAHALARAHEWQVTPENASHPVRLFRCAVALVEREREAKNSGESLFLQVEVMPEGPVGGTVPGTAGAK